MKIKKCENIPIYIFPPAPIGIRLIQDQFEILTEVKSFFGGINTEPL